MTFSFSLSLLPHFSPFLPSFAVHLVGFILVGKVFRKGFRILGLDERKGRGVVEQDFLGNFPVNVTWDAIHSTKPSGNFGTKLNGSVRSNRKSFEKTGPPFEVVLFSRSDRLEFWLNGSRPWFFPFFSGVLD